MQYFFKTVKPLRARFFKTVQNYLMHLLKLLRATFFKRVDYCAQPFAPMEYCAQAFYGFENHCTQCFFKTASPCAQGLVSLYSEIDSWPRFLFFFEISLFFIYSIARNRFLFFIFHCAQPFLLSFFSSARRHLGVTVTSGVRTHDFGFQSWHHYRYTKRAH